MKIFSDFIAKKNNRQFAVLIDPDKASFEKLIEITIMAKRASVDYFFIGGSLLTNNKLEDCIRILKDNCSIPVVLFPGNTMQISDKADAILFLSLISGRNPDLLIGKHVIAAPFLKNTSLEIIPTGYMLIDGGKTSTSAYISNTIPIPADKDEIAVCTAIAGEMLGMKTIYMDAGSGALNPVSESMISRVKRNISLPLIIGGGITTPEQAVRSSKAGADIIVVGNAIEKNSSLLTEISKAINDIK